MIVADVQDTREALDALSQRLAGRPLPVWFVDEITETVAELVMHNALPECQNCAEWAEHECECHGCEDTDKLEAARWVMLNEWPADLAPELRDSLRHALGIEQ